MDENYNSKDAGEALQAYIEDSRKLKLYHLAAKPTWLNQVSMLSVDNNRTWRMVRTDEENQLEEIVFTIQGVIVKKDLPPVNEMLSRDNYGFLQQHVRVTGLGCEAFKEMADNILKAQLVFERQFPDGAFKKWTPDNTSISIGIDISNRYLETQKPYLQEETSFEKGIDPKGILAATCTRRNLIHTEDNKVRFFSSTIDDDGERIFEVAEPQIFRVGDIVEIQLSIIAVAMKNQRNKMKLKLRTVALIDEGFTKERERAMHAKTMKEKTEQRDRMKEGETQAIRLLKRKDSEWLHTTASTFIHSSITEFDAESMPAIGTKINLTACPGPTWSMTVNICDNYYGTCERHASPASVGEGLAVVGNSSSTSRSVMVDDMAVLVPSTMPDNVGNVTFNSFGLVAHCRPVVDCLIDSLSTQSMFYCPSFNPPYNISSMHDLSSSGYTMIEMFNLTNNAMLLDGYTLDSVLNPSGARVTLYWPLSDDKTIFPAVYSSGWYVMESSYGTLGGNNTYAFADHPILSNFNTTSALFAALDHTYQTDLVDYLKSTLRSSSTLSTEAFNTVLSRNMSYAAMGLASPLFERDVSTSGNTIVLRSASRYPLAPLSAVLAILYTYAFLALAITVSSVMASSREIIITKNGGKEHRVTAIELVQLRLTNPLASIAERFSDPARPELSLETSAVDMFHEHPHADKLGVVMVDCEGENGEGIVRRRRTLRVESIDRSLTRLSGSTMDISETS